jgi:PIN domain nuclease of toxin-antitoxin system
MNLLLDTHILIWCFTQPDELRADAREKIRDGENQVYVSAASTLEMAIKSALGKLDFPPNLEELMQRSRFQELPVTIPHTMEIATMPKVHGDPFDRLLAAQAKHEGFTLVTRDQQLMEYPIKTLKA